MAQPSTHPQETDAARRIEALAQQAIILNSIFARAGFEPIAPPILQPADVFLDLVGEDLRARTYVFTDADGEELCLRPDLTIPACRLYLARPPALTPVARYSYDGPVFRFQPGGGDAAHPREFRQAGIESFGASDTAKADAEVVALSVEAVRAAGLRACKLRLGDLGLFTALLDAVEMPERWRARLRHHFWRPEAFRTQLRKLSAPEQSVSPGLPMALIKQLDPQRPADAAALVAAWLEAEHTPLSGTRTLAEITRHLMDVAADLKAAPLPAATAQLLDSYLAIVAPARAAAAQIRAALKRPGVPLGPALDVFGDRLERIAQEGVDIGQAEFSASFGRNLEYYTGLVFEIEAPALGAGINIAGGGRYDGLARAVGSGRDVAAVGSAIHCERLLTAVRGGVR